MTSTTDAAGHPDVDEISDLTEGLLPPSRSEDVQRHVDSCELCADVHSSLEEIRGLLGSLPGQTRMPVDVAERIDAALAAEALLSSTVPPQTTSPEDAAESGEGESDTSAVDVSRETSTAAPTAASPTSAPTAPADRPAGHPRGKTGPGRGSRGRAGRRRTITLGAVFTAAAIGIGSLLIQSLGGADEPGKATQQPSDSVLAFSEGKLEGQVTDLLSQRAVPQSSPSTMSSFDVRSSPDTPRSNAPLREETNVGVTVPECIKKGIGRFDAPLAAEQGTYEGTDAYLVVLPHETDTTQVSAYVVDAACARQQTGPAGKVLLTHSYARH
ncbi:hypothetical protein ACIQNU_28745 [Streptomyces sp. NPDC091292]|uniref:hypothetical protein n=1 Tax=Streptomyces sp. NPDC091292 TaxID=3365991 RepID=UPI0037FFA4EB